MAAPTILYIAGYGRSGSTVLDMLLEASPRIFGAGELTNFFQDWFRDQGMCACGEKVHGGCAFWSEVLQQFHREIPDATYARSRDVTKQMESITSLSPFYTGKRKADEQLYARVWRTLCEIISEVSHKPIIVDSSKTSRGCTQRVRLLKNVCQLDVRVIHLVRDPRAVMWSRMRGNNRFLERGIEKRPYGGILRTLTGWTTANLAAHITVAAMDRVPIARIRYEDLVADPEGTLVKLENELDLELSSVVDAVARQATFNPGHGLAGNRVRRTGQLILRSDDEWKDALPEHARYMALAVWPIASAYGYNLLDTEHHQSSV
jgi:hypothetical protein